MRKRFLLLLLCLVLIFSGCTLADPNLGAGDAGGDRLIGVYITTEYLDLFDWEAYFNDNASALLGTDHTVSDADADRYGGRIYAERIEGNGRPHMEFTSVEGSGLFVYEMEDEAGTYHTTNNSGFISDAKIHIGSESSVEGTLYIEPNSFEAFYTNPVYQSPDGRVYLIAGNGMNYGGGAHDEGEVMSMTMNETHAVTENGGSSEESFRATIHVAVRLAPTSFVLLYMSEDGEPIKRETLLPEQLPESLTVAADTAYLIVEEHALKPDGTPRIERSIVSRGEETLSAFRPVDGGFVQSVTITLNWEEN